MEAVDQLTQESAGDRPSRRALSKREDVVLTWTSPLVMIYFVGQIAVVTACAFVVYYSRMTEQSIAIQSNQVVHLESKTDALNDELVRLRQFVGSKTSEDVIYLKINILKPDIDPELAASIAKVIHRNASIYSQDTDLILAIMHIESRFDPKAESNKGALGLMQVMPQWQKVLGMSGDLTDPEISLKYGLQILGFYQEMYKNNQMALTAYNRGPGPVDMALMNGKDYNNGYADKVLAVYQRLQTMSANNSAL